MDAKLKEIWFGVISQSQYEESGENSRESQWLAVRNKESRKVLQSARNANMGLGGEDQKQGGDCNGKSPQGTRCYSGWRACLALMDWVQKGRLEGSHGRGTMATAPMRD
jgi:hypothetical protein